MEVASATLLGPPTLPELQTAPKQSHTGSRELSGTGSDDTVVEGMIFSELDPGCNWNQVGAAPMFLKVICRLATDEQYFQKINDLKLKTAP